MNRHGHNNHTDDYALNNKIKYAQENLDTFEDEEVTWDYFWKEQDVQIALAAATAGAVLLWVLPLLAPILLTLGVVCGIGMGLYKDREDLVKHRLKIKRTQRDLDSLKEQRKEQEQEKAMKFLEQKFNTQPPVTS